MKYNFKQLPKSLKKNIYSKFGLGFLFLTFFILICCFMEYPFFSVAPAAFAIFLLIDGVTMLFRCLGGEYVQILGVCKEVHKSRLRGRVKCILIETEHGIIRLNVKIKLRPFREGDNVTLYLPNNATVYEHKGEFVVSEFYAIEIRKGGA